MRVSWIGRIALVCRRVWSAKLRVAYSAGIAFLLSAVTGAALELYSTDFENFTVGADKWVGTEGWLGNSKGVGVHGIDYEIVPGLGKTAYLGFKQPSSTFVAVMRPINYNPIAASRPIIEFETLMGIQDSSNGYRDSFFFSFYNTNGSFLASIRFSNEPLTFGIWRLDGSSSQHDTGVQFVRNDLHLLYAQIDFSTGRWSADLDGISLFTNSVFNSTGRPLTLGSVSAEWQLSSSTTTNHGDNWMLVADASVRALPKGESPVRIRSVQMNSAGHPSLSWNGEEGFGYRVEYLDAMRSWQTNLPSATYTSTPSAGPITYTDTSDLPGSNRWCWYRLSRWPSP
jgi:hypothetical protein